MQPISPCGRCDFQQDESLGTWCSSNIPIWPTGSIGSVGRAIHRYMMWYVEQCHGGVRIMMRQESYNYGIMRGITITAFMPARQREMTWRYVKLLERLRFMFTPNGKREFVPRDQVLPLFFVYCLLLLHKNKQFYASFIHKNSSGPFLSAYFPF